MPQPIRVNPQELAHAAELVRGYADQLRVGHGSAITAAEAAQSGLVGQSAKSIGAKTQRWRATTAELQRVLASQADALASCGQGLRRHRGQQRKGDHLARPHESVDVMSLTVEDVLRWDPGAVRAVGDGARTRAQASTDTADSLPKFPDWTGPGSEEAKQALEETRKALMKDADAALAAARSADAAATNVQIVKDNLKQVLDTAREFGMVVDPVAGTVQPWPAGLGLPEDFQNAEVLQKAIQQVLAQANNVDQQLAAAMDQADDVVEVPPEARPIPPPPGATAEEVESGGSR